ncbi:MAG: branched-chain amino acid ABC transporter permease [Clostridiales Family XIII bacterium]|jgi:branched-chain amino acid transport system permease protein|nr:branched-chain amino acid ABC transporter permease [Clostridiales Family XIII bacterium]
MIQAIIQGILLGGLFAAVGVGMNMIFGIVKITNLAHGDFLILACYLSLFFMGSFGANPFLSLIIVVPLMFFIGFALQATMLNKVLNRGDEPPLLITFGFSIIIQNLLLYFFTANAQKLQTPMLLKSISITDTIRIPVMYLISCLAGIVIILLLGVYMKNTYMGKAIRATSDDNEAAQLMGVNIKTTYGVAMGISMMTAGVAGVLIGILFNFYPNSGSTYLIIAFAVVVIGGIGNIYGTLAAGIIFGLAQVVGGQLLGASYQQLIGYLVLLIMLIVRPQGLFSK